MPRTPETVSYVPVSTIQQMFNQSQYPTMITSGQLRPIYFRDDELSNPERIGEPAGTRSQYIRYVDKQGQWLVEVHRYLRPNGAIGASGKPDPKRIRLPGIIIYAIAKREIRGAN